MKSLPSTAVLDNEAIQALLDSHHRKHRLALFLVEGVMAQNASASFPLTRLVVPTSALSVSVADAHLGAVVSGAEGPVAVITSDTADVAKMAAFTGTSVTIVRL